MDIIKTEKIIVYHALFVGVRNVINNNVLNALILNNIIYYKIHKMDVLVKKVISMMEKILHANLVYRNAKLVYNRIYVLSVRIIWIQIVNVFKDIILMDNIASVIIINLLQNTVKIIY